MWKRKIFYTISLLICLLSLCVGCGKTAPNNPEGITDVEDTGKQNQPESGSGVPTEHQVLSPKDYVKDAYTVQCTLEEGTEYEAYVEYHVPEFTLDCAGAKQLNQMILSECGDIEEPECLEDYYNSWQSVSYEVYSYQDYLCVVLSMSVSVGEYVSFKSYNLNMKTGEIATDAELAYASGIAEAELPDLIKKAAIYESDQYTMESLTSPYMRNQEDKAYKQQVYLDSIKARVRTLEELNEHIEEAQIYLTDTGELRAYVPIQVMAGAGISNQSVSLKRQNAYQNFELTYQNGLFITYQDGHMTVRIEKNDWSEYAYYYSDLEYGKEYPVQGIFKDYIQGEMMSVMYEDYVIPVFVADDGTIAYLDLYKCAESGFFCLTEMAYVDRPIEVITKDNEQEIADALSEILFTPYEGYANQLLDLYELESAYISEELVVDDTTLVKSYKSIGFDMDHPQSFTYQVSEEDGNFYNYHGELTYMGMDENGLYLSYSLNNWDTDVSLHGMFQSTREYDWLEEMGDYSAYILYRYVSGDNLFPETNQTAKLIISVG